MFNDYRFLPIEEQEPIEEEVDEEIYPASDDSDDFLNKAKQKKALQSRKKHLYMAS